MEKNKRKFKIHIFEDKKEDASDIELYIRQLNKRLSPFNIEVDYSFSGLDDVKEEIKKVNSHLIILDLFDKKSGKTLGKDAIKHNDADKKIPTIIYSALPGDTRFDIDKQKQNYKTLLDLVIKSNEDGENLIKFLYNYILSENKGTLCFTLYNEHDLELKLSLELLGLNRVNGIIQQVNEKLELTNPLIYPMNFGLSGAILFKLKYKNYDCIIKLSKEIEKIKREHENARKLYNKFPDRLLNHIEPEEFYSFDEAVLGFLMKNVEDSITFLDYILSTDNLTEIDNKLNDLFLKQKGLKYHYANNKSKASDWSSIFNKIDESKYLMISKSYKEVSLLIEEYYKNITIENFRRLAISHDYENLSVHDTTDERYKKEQVLVHGDLHANNIMIQDNMYVKIIDTGLIGYAHWTSDISRLIVNLFINGVDYNSVDFFKLDSIKNYMTILKKIMNCEKVNLYGRNDNVFTAINWLVSNIQDIFYCFELFEFQLGLMKEFLQVSYRIDTVPANRRAFSLIAADMLMKEANKNVELVKE